MLRFQTLTSNHEQILLILVFAIILFSVNSYGQQTVQLGCQTEDVAVEDLERKNFNNGSTVIHSQGSMHNFTLPSNTFGPCKRISNITIEIDAIGVDLTNLPPDCVPTPLPYYYNIALSCPDFTPASCNTANLLGEPNTPTFVDQNLSYNGDFDFGENLSVDIVPVMNINCTAGQTSLTSDAVVLDYEICVEVTIIDEVIANPVTISGTDMICPTATTTIAVGSYAGYDWDPGGESSQTINVGPGTYMVTVTDANGCTDTDDFTIDPFPTAPITFNPIAPVACSGATVPVSVNEVYVMYEWSDLQTGQTVNLPNGSFDVTVTDNNNCTAVNSITIGAAPTPDAGTNNSRTICNDIPFDLATMVDPGADAGGVFSDPSGSGALTGSIVDPTGLAGMTINYIYTVGLASDPCGSDEATLVLIIEAPLNAGDNNSISLCEDAAPLDLSTLLSVGADPGGVFSDPSGSGSLTGSIVDVSTLGGQTINFVYTVGLITDPCGTDEATITVIVQSEPNAGDDNSLTVCDGTDVNLNTLLDINSDPGGVFSDPAGTGTLSGFTVNTLNQGGQTLNFIYEVGLATDPCGIDQATLTVIVDLFLDAGEDNSISVCEGIPVDLNTMLSATADGGGTFLDAATGAPVAATVNTNGLAGQTIDFLYEVGQGTSTCGTDFATLTIMITSSVEAGENNSVTVCEGSPVDLNTLLSADADLGGTFSDPAGSGALTGDIVTTTGLAGQTLDFVYEVGVIGDPCGTDEATLTITIETSLQAGDDNSTTVCLGETIDLNDYLVNADIGGIYNDINGSGGLTGNTLDTELITPGSYIYEYIVGDGGSCEFDTANITLLFTISPNPQFEVDTLELCFDICQEVSVTVLGDLPLTYDLMVDDQNGVLQSSTSLSNDNNTFSIFLCNDQNTIEFSNDTLNFSNTDSLLLTIDNVVGGMCNTDAIDSLWITSLPINVFQLDTSICIFDTLFIDNLEFFLGNSTYVDTISGVLCDSIININVSFDDVDTSYILETICAGDSTNYFSTWFSESNPYEEITVNADSGCDSLIIVDISFFPVADSLINSILCEGDSIIVGGVTYNDTNPFGQEILENQASNGCDSLVNIDLQFSDGINIMRTDTLCEGGSIVIGGSIFDMNNSPTQLTIPGVDCDTTFDINLTFAPPSRDTISGTFCSDFDTIINQVLYDINNPMDIETIVGGNSLGCDSIIVIDLTFVNSVVSVVDGTYCSDFDTLVNGVIYDIANPMDIETIVGGSYLGCDSIINVNLEFYPEAQKTIDTTICANASFVIDGITYDENNLTGTASLITENGCDSTIVILVSLYDVSQEDQPISICEGDSTFLMGAWQFVAGTYIDTFATSFGCDSIINTILTVMPCNAEVNVSAVGNNCVGGSQGLIDVEVISEIAIPYIIVLEDLATGDQTTINVSTELNNYQFENLNSGAYTLSILENDGSVIYTTNPTITDLFDPLGGTWNLIDTIFCADDLGQLEFIPSGGLAAYNYTWNSSDLGDAATIDQIGSGNYSITVSDMNGCTFDSSFEIIEPDAISFTIDQTGVSCTGIDDGTISLMDIQSGTAPYTIIFNGTATNETLFDSLAAGIYTVQVVDSESCTSIEQEVNITGATNDILANYDMVYNIQEGDSVVLIGDALEDNLTFEWSPDSSLSCTDCGEPTADPLITTIYDLTITNDLGCEQVVTVTVNVSTVEIIFGVPNIFSPNNDGINDEFRIFFDGPSVTQLEFLVFDRWGNQIHNAISIDGTIEWDGQSNGREFNPGVYVYQLIIDYVDGTQEIMVKDLTIIK